MRRIRCFAFSALLAALAMPGCSPKLSEEELGTIQYEVPKLPGADQPYELPPAIAAEREDGESAPVDEFPGDFPGG